MSTATAQPGNDRTDRTTVPAAPAWTSARGRDGRAPGTLREVLSRWHEKPARRWRHAPVAAAVAIVHAGAGSMLTRVEVLPTAMPEAAPLFVGFIATAPPPPPPVPAPPAPAAPPVPPSPAPPAPRPEPAPKPKQKSKPKATQPVAPASKPKPVIAAPPASAPVPHAFEPPAEPPASPLAPPAPAAPPAVPAVAAPATPPSPPAAPAGPKTVSVNAVQYIEPPEPVYPRLSRRLREDGRVVVRVLVDPQGVARELSLQHSSGHARLDQSALEAVRNARFRPYSENGVPQAVWVLVPIHFALEG